MMAQPTLLAFIHESRRQLVVLHHSREEAKSIKEMAIANGAGLLITRGRKKKATSSGTMPTGRRSWRVECQWLKMERSDRSLHLLMPEAIVCCAPPILLCISGLPSQGHICPVLRWAKRYESGRGTEIRLGRDGCVKN